MSAPHGGRLQAAAAHWGIPRADWLDVSTGIAPWSWPVPEVPEDVWARLPEDGDGLEAAAAAYYEQPESRLLAVPGSQYVIREWPRGHAPGRVAVPRVGYTEHARAWAAAGHTVCCYQTWSELRDAAPRLDHAVVLAPNNPTGAMPTSTLLAELSARLGPGRLIIDAAFADCRACRAAWPAEAIVLRSVGKFFGLAGIRLGFVTGPTDCLGPIADLIQPWGVAHPARWIGARALADRAWQASQRARIADGQAWLADRLAETWPGVRLVSGGLFVTVQCRDVATAPAWHAGLARQGVLTRLGDYYRWLRFGLVRQAHRLRLARALARLATAAS